MEMITTDEKLHSGQADAAGLAYKLEEQCARAEEFFARERLRLEQIESVLLERLETHFAHDTNGVTGVEPERAVIELTAERDELLSLCEDLQNQLQQVQSSGPDTELAAALEEAVRDREQLAQRVDELDQALRESAAALESLEEQRQQLAEQCAHWQAQLNDQAAESAGEDETQPEQLQQELQNANRRYELAIEDLREARERCEQLSSELAEAKTAIECLPSDAEGTSDWELQKTRLLAALDAGSDVSPVERATIEETIRTTNEAIAAKDQEIAELKRLIEAAGDGPLQTTDDVEARREQQVAEILDADELIQTEREKLLQMQEEIAEKQRRAEVEISLERAKMARAKAALEEQVATLMRERDESGKHEEPNDDDADKGGRWRARLGLSDD